jgi:seryl-tRNA synthetase
MILGIVLKNIEQDLVYQDYCYKQMENLIETLTDKEAREKAINDLNHIQHKKNNVTDSQRKIIKQFEQVNNELSDSKMNLNSYLDNIKEKEYAVTSQINNLKLLYQ